MRQSELFTKTSKEAPKDEVAKNAILLERAGFVFKNSAGVYSFLPLGWKVMQKIAGIVREEMNAIGGQEIFMPAMIEKKYMEPTERWNLDIGFFTKGLKEKDANFVLGWSHEEVLTAIASKFTGSYKDLPFSAYQIQTKFRNEPRAKSGILRGREFMMKDLYSFHADEASLSHYYEEVKTAYFKIFERCGLKSIYTLAGGGIFTSNFTHEFQVVSEVGEDTILLCQKCEYAENTEISKLKEGNNCPKCGGKIIEKKSIEVGNIFNNGIKYSKELGLYFKDKNGEKNPVWMAAYGIGLSRLMATIVETHNDENGIIWPESVAPFDVHLIVLGNVSSEGDKIYESLTKENIEVLYDDRDEKTAGEKFADSDLIGIPLRVVISQKTLEKDSVEIRKRDSKEIELITIKNLNSYINR
ncbi:MAG: aminoacyl--tRNA ligase-related protein [Patescibacteria group bacterium]